MKISPLLMFACLAVASSAQASHIYFAPVTGNGVTLSESASEPTLLVNQNVTFATTVEGPLDTITFDFGNPLIPDFSFFGSGPVSFTRFIPVGIPQSVFVNLSSSFPDYVNASGQHVDGQTFYLQTSGVPEPSTVAFLGSGLTALIGFSRRRRTQNR
jgi:hypothetical protein